MLKAKDFRMQAWNAKTGKWGTLALTAFVMSIISGLCAGLTAIGIGAIVSLIITGPLTLGLVAQSVKVIKGEDVAVGDLFSGFGRFLEAFLAHLLVTIFTALWSLLFVIPGIIKSYSYSMTFYVLNDNPGMAANDARKKSMEIMRGNKWRLFCLDFSFIGWYLLSILTLGILMFWITPYHNAARAAFYKSITASETPAEAPSENEVGEVSESAAE
jgi:uncharacterized membrane protein